MSSAVKLAVPSSLHLRCPSPSLFSTVPFPRSSQAVRLNSVPFPVATAVYFFKRLFRLDFRGFINESQCARGVDVSIFAVPKLTVGVFQLANLNDADSDVFIGQHHAIFVDLRVNLFSSLDLYYNFIHISDLAN